MQEFSDGGRTLSHPRRRPRHAALPAHQAPHRRRRHFERLLEAHPEARGVLVNGVVAVSRAQTANLGLLQLDENQRVLCLAEKPATEGQLDQFRTAPEWLAAHGITSRGREYL